MRTIKKIFSNDWVVALICLLIFLIAHGYRFNWDDHHGEIPLLKSLMDPSLYPRDYFVQSLKENFTFYLYPMIAAVIGKAQIPTAYFILFCISRYFLFFWVYKFWQLITKDKGRAFLCTMTLLVLVRVHGFMYLTFSHDEFCLIFVFGALYYFYKDRYLLSALMAGIATDFHALYGFYAMTFLGVYLLIFDRKNKWKNLLKACGVYAVFSLPFYAWSFSSAAWSQVKPSTAVFNQWLTMYKETLPGNFFFSSYFKEIPLSEAVKHPLILLVKMRLYLYALTLYSLLCLQSEKFYRQPKNHVIAMVSFTGFVVNYIVSYIYPVKFLLAMDFLRNIQFLYFLLPGYVTYLVFTKAEEEKPWFMYILVLLLCGVAGKELIGSIFVGMMILFLYAGQLRRQVSTPARTLKMAVAWGGLVVLLGWYFHIIRSVEINPLTNPAFMADWTILTVILALAVSNWGRDKQRILLPLMVIVPFAVNTVAYSYAHYQKITGPKTTLERLVDDWVDVQHHTRELTPKDALILVPYNMELGGFRNFSERSVVVSYQDISHLMILDVPAAFDWKQRIEDIKEFKVVPKEPLGRALNNAITKYGADYVVFTTRAMPQPNEYLRLLYANASFALYKVEKAPADEKNAHTAPAQGSFIAAGHAYGSHDGANVGLYPKFVDALSEPEFDGVDFLVLVGDIVRRPTAQAWETVEQQLRRLGLPAYYVMGNHDNAPLSRLVFQRKFGGTAYSFIQHNTLFVVLDCQQPWGIIPPKQLAMLNASLASFKDKNVFVFLHELLWTSHAPKYKAVRHNYGSYDPYFRSNFWPEVFPILNRFKDKNIFVIAGDVAASGTNAVPAFFEQLGHIRLIATGMGEHPDENFLLVTFTGDKPTLRLIPLNKDNTLQDLRQYTVDYLQKSAAAPQTSAH